MVKGLTERHVPRATARTVVEETTPPPSPEALEARRIERLLAPRQESARLTHRERRERDRWRGL